MYRALAISVSTSKRRAQTPEASDFPGAAQLYLFGLALATVLATAAAFVQIGP